MKKKHTGRTVFLIIVLLLLLTGAGLFVASYFFNVQIPFVDTVKETVLGWIGGIAGKEETVYVQSVANILGVGYTGKSNRYSGVVEARNVVEINPNTDLKIAECFVKAGDEVHVGTPLFGYDVENLSLSYEQLVIEIMGLENTIRTSTEEIESLGKRIAKARESKKYELVLKQQETQLTLKKSEYELKNKQKQAGELEHAIADSVVKSPVDGRIRSVKSDDNSSNPYGNMDQEASNAYITIVAGSDYCIKGTVNEQTVRTLVEGMPVTIRPRTDENMIYRGTIYRINTDEPLSDSNAFYYDGGGGERSSKYAFYVSLESIEGLIMGQHVTIELGETSEDDGKMWLPAYYLVPDGNGFAVYRANANGKIEKRTVQVGAYREEKDSYEILSGLSFVDRIAFPDGTIQEGMNASETVYAEEHGEMPEGMSDYPEEFAMNEGTDPLDPFGENNASAITFEISDVPETDSEGPGL